ncbi:hypothetical protein [Candidatus Neomicrothrix sp.]|jgi:hypothetical protein|nr:hypothetical protein [Candidatus Microthrix sp.]MBP7404725.1 hypothetical protein [Candidatus Microthrix sp.]MBP7854173.1 hypothetical protein [Candidatus Microthrix sp.]MBP8958727.1 hypothetical protein [Candidatus Microthrix sp.]
MEQPVNTPASDEQQPSAARRAIATSGVMAIVAALVAYFGRRSTPPTTS